MSPGAEEQLTAGGFSIRDTHDRSVSGSPKTTPRSITLVNNSRLRGTIVYHSNKPIYSWIAGQEFTADIYTGVAYYLVPAAPLTHGLGQILGPEQRASRPINTTCQDSSFKDRPPIADTQTCAFPVNLNLTSTDGVEDERVVSDSGTRHLFSASGLVDELFRLFDRLGLQNVWKHDLSWV